MDAASNDGEVMKLKVKREKVEAERENVKALLRIKDNARDAFIDSNENMYLEWQGLSRAQLSDEIKRLDETRAQLSDEIKRLDERELAYLRAAAPGKYTSEEALL